MKTYAVSLFRQQYLLEGYLRVNPLTTKIVQSDIGWNGALRKAFPRVWRPSTNDINLEKRLARPWGIYFDVVEIDEDSQKRKNMFKRFVLKIWCWLYVTYHVFRYGF